MFRCKKCGTTLNDWRGHAESCPQAGMPESIEVAPPQPTFIPYPVYPHYAPVYQPTYPGWTPYYTVTSGGANTTGNLPPTTATNAMPQLITGSSFGHQQ